MALAEQISWRAVCSNPSGDIVTVLAYGNVFLVAVGSPMVDVYPCEISVPSLGMNVQIWDEKGSNIEELGEPGDLVLVSPFFSMPMMFWSKGDEEMYRKANFKRYPGIWCRGDFIKRSPATGGYDVLGRSDGVLNPGCKLPRSSTQYLRGSSNGAGVRFGTAELYDIFDRFTEIEDCIAVAQKLRLQDGSIDE